jgi:hypothetical protein
MSAKMLSRRAQQPLFLLRAVLRGKASSDAAIADWMKKELVGPVEAAVGRIVDRYLGEGGGAREDECDGLDLADQEAVFLLEECRSVDLVGRYDGANSRDREAHRRNFNDFYNPFVLLVSRVGEEGIDLQKQCRYVVHYDLEWNPAKMEQREGRVDRVGWGRAEEGFIDVRFLLLKGTYEERIFHTVMQRDQWFQILIGSKGRRAGAAVCAARGAGRKGRRPAYRERLAALRTTVVAGAGQRQRAAAGGAGEADHGLALRCAGRPVGGGARGRPARRRAPSVAQSTRPVSEGKQKPPLFSVRHLTTGAGRGRPRDRLPTLRAPSSAAYLRPSQPAGGGAMPEQLKGVDMVASLVEGHARLCLDDLKRAGDVPRPASAVADGGGWVVLMMAFPQPPEFTIPPGLPECDAGFYYACSPPSARARRSTADRLTGRPAAVPDW